MPKVGMEPLRREAIVRATIAEIGEARSLDVTVTKIANRAGMSSALAHHYFGGKDQIFLAAMRQLMRDFGDEVLEELALTTPDTRADAIVRACFKTSCFTAEGISAWMTFYGLVQSQPDALRLWRIYQARLRTNLCHALRGQVRDPAGSADTLAALIDGLYLRAALEERPNADQAAAKALAMLTLLRRSGQ
ncbi:transcriptional regulator BetI [Aliisedimentitalea scapharcae]|uniref:HTH-type transcriptional regulator BetI n=1 Tax=Aliisedimentitalea scapharcae TaxID=1524259 RepID=A0ABZ2XPU2_9RHOB|nr:transcriptional regulator BetI [Rhodobacteraceae bacterium M382]